MTNLTEKTDTEIDQWIRNHEQKGATSAPLYLQLLEERARRSQEKGHLNIDMSLELLAQAAIEQRCVTYGDLAKASKVGWSQARHRMSGANGHLDRLLDVCHARGLPMLPAICVNESGRDNGELEASALGGFAAGARRLGVAVAEERSFHRQARDACWHWGREQSRTG
ncbi:hypothetical protein [Mesorhizobium sp.]|uniref:hypothetical protein n=1 Tax=Mesorhizobium sp. TaxID=1871066 RepID=UPI000FEA7B30|nr:hypothetical protein [Mesorhizobium sp.]RWN25284.1 MAG: hypothetical protein EOR95_29240 [Mesorhizobium sp.]